MIIIRAQECELENKKQHPGPCVCAGFFNGLPFGGETVVGFESTCAKTTKKKNSRYIIFGKRIEIVVRLVRIWARKLRGKKCRCMLYTLAAASRLAHTSVDENYIICVTSNYARTQ